VSHHRLDARRLLCPMPVIRTQDKMRELQDGDTLEVICSDPGALHDIPAWCRVHGHEMLSATQDSGDIIITLRAHNTAEEP
jgi:tRNA 2-thiouridine synthesizing protein A